MKKNTKLINLCLFIFLSSVGLGAPECNEGTIFIFASSVPCLAYGICPKGHFQRTAGWENGETEDQSALLSVSTPGKELRDV